MNDTKDGSKQDLGMLGHSCHVQAHEEGCEDHGTGCLFCDGLNTDERRKHRRRLERSALSPGLPGLEKKIGGQPLRVNQPFRA
jgi:hypothetical protein